MADLTVAELWQDYSKVSRRDNDTWRTELGRAKHLARHLGAKRASQLSLADVDAYRSVRLDEVTVRGAPPAPATLDREVELLKRVLNYAVKCRRLYANPIADVQLLGKSNVRRSVIRDAEFDQLLAAAPSHLKPILIVAYDTGMRLMEILTLRWAQYDKAEGCVELHAGDTKSEEGRKVYLTKRANEALAAIDVKGPFVFTNPKTGSHYDDVRKVFGTAAEAIGRPGLWFHDLRRSFVTRARRKGIPESVVMRMSGHRSASVFKRYNIIFDSDVADAARKLEE